MLVKNNEKYGKFGLSLVNGRSSLKDLFKMCKNRYFLKCFTLFKMLFVPVVPSETSVQLAQSISSHHTSSANTVRRICSHLPFDQDHRPPTPLVGCPRRGRDGSG